MPRFRNTALYILSGQLHSFPWLQFVFWIINCPSSHTQGVSWFHTASMKQWQALSSPHHFSNFQTCVWMGCCASCSLPLFHSYSTWLPNWLNVLASFTIGCDHLSKRLPVEYKQKCSAPFPSLDLKKMYVPPLVFSLPLTSSYNLHIRKRSTSTTQTTTKS